MCLYTDKISIKLYFSEVVLKQGRNKDFDEEGGGDKNFDKEEEGGERNKDFDEDIRKKKGSTTQYVECLSDARCKL